MVYRKKRTQKGRRRGGSKLINFIKKTNKFLRNSRLVSNVGAALHKSGIPYAGKVGTYANTFGYGRRRRRGGYISSTGSGGSLRPAGGAMSPAGGMRRRRR